MKFNFGGVSGKVKEGIEDKFDLVYDSSPTEMIYRTKKTYKHEEDGLEFDYYYAIVVRDLYEITGDKIVEDIFDISVELIVDNKSICATLMESILYSTYLEDEDDVDVVNVLSYGGANVTLLYEDFHKDYLDEKIIGAMCSIEPINNFKEFYLDKAWNKLGTTGWDVVKYAIGLKDRLFD